MTQIINHKTNYNNINRETVTRLVKQEPIKDFLDQFLMTPKNIEQMHKLKNTEIIKSNIYDTPYIYSYIGSVSQLYTDIQLLKSKKAIRKLQTITLKDKDYATRFSEITPHGKELYSIYSLVIDEKGKESFNSYIETKYNSLGELMEKEKCGLKTGIIKTVEILVKCNTSMVKYITGSINLTNEELLELCCILSYLESYKRTKLITPTIYWNRITNNERTMIMEDLVTITNRIDNFLDSKTIKGVHINPVFGRTFHIPGDGDFIIDRTLYDIKIKRKYTHIMDMLRQLFVYELMNDININLVNYTKLSESELNERSIFYIEDRSIYFPLNDFEFKVDLNLYGYSLSDISDTFHHLLFNPSPGLYTDNFLNNVVYIGKNNNDLEPKTFKEILLDDTYNINNPIKLMKCKLEVHKSVNGFRCVNEPCNIKKDRVKKDEIIKNKFKTTIGVKCKETGEIYKTITSAFNDHGMSKNMIRRNLNNKCKDTLSRKHNKRVTWEEIILIY